MDDSGERLPAEPPALARAQRVAVPPSDDVVHFSTAPASTDASACLQRHRAAVASQLSVFMHNAG
jgi:hypothetical protein